MKKCNVCGEEKELSAFQKIRAKKDGSFTYSSRCMKCNNRLSHEKLKQDKDRLAERKAKRLEWEAKNKESLKEYSKKYAKKRWAEKKAKEGIKDNRKGPENDATRTCGACGETKPIDQFNRDRFDESREYLWRSFTCKACMNAYQKAYRDANPDKRAKFYALTKEWVDKNREEINAYHREYAKANPDQAKRSKRKWLDKNLKKMAAYYRVYNKKRKAIDPEYVKTKREYCRTRTLRRRQVGGSHTIGEWEALKAATGNKCLCCGVSGDEVALTRDHVVPLSKGGTDDISNIQPLCASCNSKKRARTIDYRG